MKIQFLLKNYLLYIFIFSLFLSKIKSIEDEYDFLKDKTVDNLRQIFWTGMNLLKSKKGYKSIEEEVNLKYESIWRTYNRQNIREIIKKAFGSTMKSIMEDEYLFNQTKSNSFFQLDTIDDLKNLINNENLPTNFLINFAFNIDKYDRTKKQAINSASDYINYYSREQLKEFINNKINEHFNIKTNIKTIYKIVLNDYFLDSKDTTTASYISSKSKEEYIQYIYGFEKYCFHSNNVIEESCYLAYNLYTHTKLDTYSLSDLSIKISTFNRKLNLDKNLDDFIFLIENRRFTYPNNKDLLKPIEREQLISNIIAFETYFRRQTNTTSFLRKLEPYIRKMEDKHMREILEWGISLYPELGQLERFQDITSSENNLQYGQVKQFVKIKDRDELLKYAYNIHTYQNNIKSIYDNDIYDFIRISDNALYDKIFKDTNKNSILQEKVNFTIFANLHANNFEKYIHNLQRNQLRILVAGLIEIFYKNSEYNDADQVKIPSEKKEKLDLLGNENNQELLDNAMKYGQYTGVQNTKNIFEYDFVYNGAQNISRYFIYNENIMDFFRSTDINYLKLWLRKYEIIIRKIKYNSYVSGGLKTNFMNINEYTKNDLLSNFDEYIFEYPDMFFPENFIKIVGLDTGITPHKYLVENAENKTLIKQIALSMVGHLQRKNVQTNFDWEDILLNFVFPYDYYHNQSIIKNREIYQLFRMINICPELNNYHLFEIMCVNNETRIINTQEIEINGLDIFNQEKLEKIVENIDYYYEKTDPDEIKSKDYDSKSYIIAFLKKSNNDVLNSRIIDGDFYPLFYDYTLYLKDEKKEVINKIYNKLLRENKTVSLGDDEIDKKIKAIAQAINDYKELQEPSEFDKNYYYIDFASEGYSDINIIELYKFLNKSNIREVFYYCLIANILAIENKEEIHKNKENIRDIYLKMHYIPKITMIRYILDVAKLKGEFTKKLSPDNLPILVKKYMLDIGSDYIYDLTIY